MAPKYFADANCARESGENGCEIASEPASDLYGECHELLQLPEIKRQETHVVYQGTRRMRSITRLSLRRERNSQKKRPMDHDTGLVDSSF
jgi:hypothetical protein